MWRNSMVKKLVFIVGGVILLLVILFGVVPLFLGGRVFEYDEIEEKMVDAAEAYYKKKDQYLPKNPGETDEVTVEQLVKDGYMKSIATLLKKKETSCTGKVTVSNSNNNYYYGPYLECGEDYTSNLLSKKITSSDYLVTSGDGLYNIGNEYVFRGEKVNNRIEFANKDWVILKVLANGNIRVMEDEKKHNSFKWDDRYNSELKRDYGINNYSVSRMKEALNGLYNDPDYFSDTDKAMLVTHDLCTGKRNPRDTSRDGSPECSTREPNQTIGLIQVNEFVTASLDANCKIASDPQCGNYNFLSHLNNIYSYWTITPSTSNTAKVFLVNYGLINESNASNRIVTAPVIILTKDVRIKSGTGTITDPYTIY